MVAEYRKAVERRFQPFAASGEGRRPRPVNEQANRTCFLRQPTARKGPFPAQGRANPYPLSGMRCRSRETYLGRPCQR
jgi:hypothetical protein